VFRVQCSGKKKRRSAVAEAYQPQTHTDNSGLFDHP
jgi:hypothetical protein